MGPYYYKVIRIDGDYAHLLRTNTDCGDTILVALALLPDGTDEGTELIWENLEYSIISV